MNALRRRRHRAGFTLMEVLITLGIFLLLSSAILGIIIAVLRSATTLQRNQNQQDQVMGLRAYLGQHLEELVAQSSLVSYRRGDGEGLPISGLIFGPADVMTALDARIQPNGYYTLRLAQFAHSEQDNPTLNTLVAFQNVLGANDARLRWRPLITDVEHITWQFQDANTPTWLPAWPNSDHKPTLVELSIQLAGDPQPTVMDFWLPPRDANSVVIPGAEDKTP